MHIVYSVFKGESVWQSMHDRQVNTWEFSIVTITIKIYLWQAQNIHLIQVLVYEHNRPTIHVQTPYLFQKSRFNTSLNYYYYLHIKTFPQFCVTQYSSDHNTSKNKSYWIRLISRHLCSGILRNLTMNSH